MVKPNKPKKAGRATPDDRTLNATQKLADQIMARLRDERAHGVR